MPGAPSINPFRIEYITPDGQLQWTDPIASRDEALVIEWKLGVSGNTIVTKFHDSASPAPCGYGSNIAKPWRWIGRLLAG